MTDTLEAILSEDYLGDLTAIDMDALRERRAACKDIETGLSYLRRLVQGRLDVVAAERSRRADGGAPDDMEDLLSRLPGLLAEKTRSTGTGRLPSEFGPGLPDPALAAELDHIVADNGLAGDEPVTDSALAAATEQLADLERRVSELRRALFGRIDAIEDELTRRYRSGEASVDSLLH